MHHLIILALPTWLFGVFAVGNRFVNFCAKNRNSWWAFPLWMAGALTVFVPAFFGGSLDIIYLAFFR